MRFGTAFVMVRLVVPDSIQGRLVLISAKHVFDDIRGDEATLLLRKRSANGDAYPFPFKLNIRKNGVKLYTEHPTADVVAMDVELPSDSIVMQRGGENIINVNWLASDSFLEKINIHPGDELLCLGFPLGIAANEAGYPILRGGKIASYPIIPLKKATQILYDFQVQPGNSGGPAYFSYTNRFLKDNILDWGMMRQKLMGIVTQKKDPVGNVDPYIAVIVPSIYIKETIDKLAGFESKTKDE